MYLVAKILCPTIQITERIRVSCPARPVSEYSNPELLVCVAVFQPLVTKCQCLRNYSQNPEAPA